MRAHRTLVYVTDDETRWGFFCLDCQLEGFGYTSDVRPGRLATRHEKETRPVLQEAS